MNIDEPFSSNSTRNSPFFPIFSPDVSTVLYFPIRSAVLRRQDGAGRGPRVDPQRCRGTCPPGPTFLGFTCGKSMGEVMGWKILGKSILSQNRVGKVMDWKILGQFLGLNIPCRLDNLLEKYGKVMKKTLESPMDWNVM